MTPLEKARRRLEERFVPASVIADFEAAVRDEALAPREVAPELAEYTKSIRNRWCEHAAKIPLKGWKEEAADEYRRSLMSAEYDVADFVAAEVARLQARPAPAVESAERETVCHDCAVVLISEPVLCESCVSRRNAEGMDVDDWRTIDEWIDESEAQSERCDGEKGGAR